MYACSTQSVISEVPSELHSAAALFAEAENFYKLNSYENARKAYEEYLVRFPDRPNADTALLRIATIFSMDIGICKNFACHPAIYHLKLSNRFILLRKVLTSK